MNIVSVTSAAGLLFTLYMIPAHSSAQDHWSRIKVGETSRELVQKVLGPATEQKSTFDGDYSIWKSKLQANEIWLRFSNDSLVQEMIVFPSGQLREAQLTEFLGPSKQRLSAAGNARLVVAYPVGKATVEYATTGFATKITVGADALKRAEGVVLKDKAAVGLSSLFGKKKKP